MELERKYGVQTDIYFPLIVAGATDFATSSDYTYAAGDIKISKDGGAAANPTNSPSFVTMGNGAMLKLTLTATEMQAAKIVVTVIDAATKAVDDQMILIVTYGNASGEHAVDRDDSVRGGMTALPNAAADAAGGLIISDAGGLAADTLFSNVTDILADTNELQSDDYPTTLAQITAKTDNLPSDPADESLIIAATDAITSALAVVDGNVDLILTDTGTTIPALIDALPTAAENADAVWDEARSGHTTAGTFGEAFVPIASGTVSTGTTSATTSSFAASDITEATADHFIGRTIIFVTGALAKQATDITDYALTSGEGVFTVTTMTEAPANGDKFLVL